MGIREKLAKLCEQYAVYSDNPTVLRELLKLSAMVDMLIEHVEQVDPDKILPMLEAVDNKIDDLNARLDALNLEQIEQELKDIQADVAYAKAKAETAEATAEEAKSKVDAMEESIADSFADANTKIDKNTQDIAGLKTSVSEAATKAEQASTAADAAKSDAEDAKTDAAQAKLLAQNVSDGLEQAKSDASDAKLSAQQAASDAKDAKSTAEQAASDAAEAKGNAESALTAATNAAQTAGEAKTEAENARAQAESAYTIGEQAQTAAANAQRQADAAVTTANEAMEAVGGKQDQLTFDDTPKSGSQNPVTSDGIYKAIQAGSGGQTITLDNEVTQDSENGVKSSGIYTAIENAKNELSEAVQAADKKAEDANSAAESANTAAHAAAQAAQEANTEAENAASAAASAQQTANAANTAAEGAASEVTGLKTTVNSQQTEINNNSTAISELQVGKMNAMSVDSAPNENSNNLVTSGGVYKAVKAVDDDLNSSKELLASQIMNKQDKLKAGSTNILTAVLTTLATRPTSAGQLVNAQAIYDALQNAGGGGGSAEFVRHEYTDLSATSIFIGSTTYAISANASIPDGEIPLRALIYIKPPEGYSGEALNSPIVVDRPIIPVIDYNYPDISSAYYWAFSRYNAYRISGTSPILYNNKVYVVGGVTSEGKIYIVGLKISDGAISFPETSNPYTNVSKIIVDCLKIS